MLTRPAAASSAVLLLVLAGAAGPLAAQRRSSPVPKPPTFFATPLTLDQMKGKQAVLETSLGPIVIAFLPEHAPNHVGYFMKLAGEGAYNGTTFHRAVKYGIVQGGDPISKDPAKRQLYGTGGLGVLQRELNDEQHTRGAVSAVLQPGKPDSAGAQFFICVTDQPALDGQHTVFGRVVEGMEVVEQISAAPTDPDGRIVDRLEIKEVTIRDTPPPEVEPFSTEPIEEIARYRAVLETSVGEMPVELFGDRAPQHVRQFLRLASAGVYEGMGFHRIVPGFVAQTGSLASRSNPLTARQQRYVRPLQPEFSDLKHGRGIVSMARGEDPASATTSFFICFGPAPSLDGKYTVFGKVTEAGLETLAALERTPVEGETPKTPVALAKVRIEKP